MAPIGEARISHGKIKQAPAFSFSHPQPCGPELQSSELPGIQAEFGWLSE